MENNLTRPIDFGNQDPNELDLSVKYSDFEKYKSVVDGIPKSITKRIGCVTGETGGTRFFVWINVSWDK